MINPRSDAMAILYALKRWIDGYPVLRLGFWSLFATNIGSAFNFLTQILLVRNLSADQLGDFNSIMSLTMVGYSYLILIPLIVTRSIIEYKDDKAKIANFIKNTLMICLIPYVIISTAILMSYSSVTTGLRIQNGILIFLALIFPLMYTINNVVVGILQGFERYSQLLFWQFFQPAILFMLTLVFVKVFLWGSTGAIIASGSAYALCLVYFSSRTLLSFPFLLNKRSDMTEKFFHIMRKTSKMILPVALYAFIMLIINNADILLAKRTFDPQTAGSYVAVSSLARIPIMVTAPFISLLFPKIISDLNAGNGSFGTIMQAFLLTFLVSGSLCLLLGIFPDTILTALYGRMYESAAAYLPKLSINMAILACLNILFTAVLAAKAYQYLYFSLVVLLAGNAYLYWLRSCDMNDFINKLVALSTTVTLGNLLLLLYSYYRKNRQNSVIS